MTHFLLFSRALAFLALAAAASAGTFRFDTDPFAGTNVTSIPGRQVLGGELFVNFSTAHDVFSFDSRTFGVPVSRPVHFFNAPESSLPSGGVNVIVLETFDDDDNLQTGFNAATAANLISNHIATPGPGFFIYFNQSLSLPRLVYSTDLSSRTSDLRILARLLDFQGQEGREKLQGFAAANFRITSPVPEPSSFWMLSSLLVACWVAARRRLSDIARDGAQQS